MVKRIWFVQQKPYQYMPLRMGLGYIQAKEVYNFNGNDLTFVPKIFTTRSHPMSGEYYVVEGSRFKAKPVEPDIRFKATNVAELNLHGVFTFRSGSSDLSWKTFPEMDLGIRGSTFEMLRDELLRLNKKATLDTPFYVSQLDKI